MADEEDWKGPKTIQEHMYSTFCAPFKMEVAWVWTSYLFECRRRHSDERVWDSDQTEAGFTILIVKEAKPSQRAG